MMQLATSSRIMGIGCDSNRIATKHTAAVPACIRSRFAATKLQPVSRTASHKVAIRPITQASSAASSSAGSSGDSAAAKSQVWDNAASVSAPVGTVALVGLSAAAVIVPQTVFSRVLAGAPAIASETLLRHVAVSAWPTAAILLVLGDAARNQRLNSDTYQRLASYVAVAFSVATVLSAVYVGNLGIAWQDTATLKTVATALTGITALTGTAGLIAGKSANNAPSWWVGLPQHLQEAFGKLTAANKTSESGLWQVLTFLLPFVLPLLVFRSAVGSWLWDVPLSKATALEQLLFKLLALFSVGGAFAAFSLKDASDRGRLGGTTFKILRDSLAASGVANVLVAVLHAFGTGTQGHRFAFIGLAATVVAVLARWIQLETERRGSKA